MKLELKHLSAYLPYGLKLKFTSKHDVDRLSKEDIVVLKQIDEGSICVNGYKTNNKSYKPILRPLSDLTKEIEVNGEKFVPILKMERLFKINPLWDGWEFKHISVELPIEIWNKLFEWHFDVFELIPQGLAIDINTLKP